MYGLYEDNGHVHLLLEYLKGGSLKTHLSKFPVIKEPMMKIVFRQLIKGLNEVH